MTTKILKIISFILILVCSIEAHAELFERDFPAKMINRVVVDADFASIRIRGTVSETGSVLAHKTCSDKYILKVDHYDGTLNVVLKKKLSYRDPCHVMIMIETLPEVDLFVTSRSGDITVHDLKGQVIFNVGSGDVDIESDVRAIIGKSVSGNINGSGKIAKMIIDSDSGSIQFDLTGTEEKGPVEINNHSGDVKIVGLNQSANVRSTSGDVDLKYAAVPAKGKLSVTTATGNIVIRLPIATNVGLDLESHSGKVVSALGNNQNGSFQVVGHSYSGHIKAKKY